MELWKNGSPRKVTVRQLAWHELQMVRSMPVDQASKSFDKWPDEVEGKLNLELPTSQGRCAD